MRVPVSFSFLIQLLYSEAVLWTELEKCKISVLSECGLVVVFLVPYESKVFQESDVFVMAK